MDRGAWRSTVHWVKLKIKKMDSVMFQDACSQRDIILVSGNWDSASVLGRLAAKGVHVHSTVCFITRVIPMFLGCLKGCSKQYTIGTVKTQGGARGGNNDMVINESQILVETLSCLCTEAPAVAVSPLQEPCPCRCCLCPDQWGARPADTHSTLWEDTGQRGWFGEPQDRCNTAPRWQRLQVYKFREKQGGSAEQMGGKWHPPSPRRQPALLGEGSMYVQHMQDRHMLDRGVTVLLSLAGD